MKQTFITVVLMLLAFMAGWFFHAQQVKSFPVADSQQRGALDYPVPQSSQESHVKDVPVNVEVVKTESTESILQALLLSHQYQQAINVYRDSVQTGDTAGSKLYSVIYDYLKNQLSEKNFSKALELSNLFLEVFPRDYPVATVKAKAMLALGDRQKSIEWMYVIVHYVPQAAEQERIFDLIHDLSIEEYIERSRQQEWRELGVFYRYLLTQENTYWPYYLYYAMVLISQQEYSEAENYLLPLLNHEEFRSSAQQMLQRLKLLQTGGQVLSLQQSGENYVAAVRLNDTTEANLLLDTGASLSVMSPEIFQRLSAQDYEFLQRNVVLQTANGPVKADMYRIHQLQLGKYQLADVEFAVLPVGDSLPDFSGLLGMNVLNRFRFEIDQINKELVLQPQF